MGGLPDESVERWAVRRVRGTRNRLLEAAAVLVQERGLHGFTFDDVASAAGVSRATAYRAFPGPPFLHVVTRPTLGALPLPGALPSLEEAAEQLAAGWLRAYAA